MQDRDDERLGPATVGERERRADALEVEVREELERCLMVRADRDSRDVDAEVLEDPGVKLVVCLRPVFTYVSSKDLDATNDLAKILGVHCVEPCWGQAQLS